VAALIKDEIGVDAQLLEGTRGEFTVWVGDEQVAQKDAGGFPIESAIVSAVQRALGKNL